MGSATETKDKREEAERLHTDWGKQQQVWTRDSGGINWVQSKWRETQGQEVEGKKGENFKIKEETLQPRADEYSHKLA